MILGDLQSCEERRAVVLGVRCFCNVFVLALDGFGHRVLAQVVKRGAAT